MLELQYKSTDANTYLVAEVPERAILDQRTLNVQLVNDIPGLAPMTVVDKFGSVELRYLVTSRVTLETFLATPISEETLVAILDSLTTTLGSLGRYQLDLRFIVLDCAMVFVDVSDSTCQLICLPTVDAPSPDAVPHGFGEFMGRLLDGVTMRDEASYDAYGKLMKLVKGQEVTIAAVAEVLKSTAPKQAATVAGRQEARRGRSPSSPAGASGSVLSGEPQPAALSSSTFDALPSPPLSPGEVPGAATNGASLPSPPPDRLATAPTPTTTAPAPTTPSPVIPRPTPAVPLPGPNIVNGVAVPPPAAAMPAVAPVASVDAQRVSMLRGLFGSKADTQAWHAQLAAGKAARANGQGHVSTLRGLFGSKADTQAWHAQLAAKKAAKLDAKRQQAARQAPPPPPVVPLPPWSLPRGSSPQ
ncbi:MAG: DUF6382 domain-containing protein [Propionibacteriaceae bacterium]|nr:DUF6382 domain-containing protein [Propionibacteriaceae bacterium]